MGILEKLSGSKKKAPAKKAEAKAGAKKTDAATQARGPLATDLGGTAYRVLLAPIFTEKSAMLQASGKYVFSVAKSATKVDVARAVRELYGVKPVSVRVVVAKGKIARTGRFSGREKDVKKAIVTLKQGDVIQA